MNQPRAPPAYTPAPTPWTRSLFQWAYTRIFVGIIHKFIKYMLHLITGVSEIERICRSNDKVNIKAWHIVSAISFSVQLKNLKQQFQQPDLEGAVNQLITIKRISPEAQPELRAAFVPIKNLQSMKAALVIKMLTPYQSNNAVHEQQLESLWQVLKPNITRKEGRFTKEWEEIGFQGKDPATDFRGMGILGLVDMLTFAQNRTVLAHQVLTTTQLPFAIVGIKITAVLLQWLRAGDLDEYFLTHGTDKIFYDELYAQFFAQFAKFYAENQPRDLMSFPPLWNKFCSMIYESRFRTLYK